MRKDSRHQAGVQKWVRSPSQYSSCLLLGSTVLNPNVPPLLCMLLQGVGTNSRGAQE